MYFVSNKVAKELVREQKIKKIFTEEMFELISSGRALEVKIKTNDGWKIIWKR